MSTFVLVHPAWFGGWCWAKVSPILRSKGHDVRTPTLTGLGERVHLANREVGLETHVQDIANLIKFENLRDVILVGNSSGGAVITGIADRVPERIANVVYLDAFIPEDGQSMFDMVPPDRRAPQEALIEAEGDGWLVPRLSPAPWDKFVPEAWGITDEADLDWVLARLVPTPVGHFTEAVRRKNPAGERLPRTYIRCRRWSNQVFDRYAEAAKNSEGWRCFELDASHVPFITQPQELADILMQVAANNE